MAQYDANGHEMVDNDAYCYRCGGQAIGQCENGHAMKERWDDEFGLAIRPDYCHECGVAYPWVES